MSRKHVTRYPRESCYFCGADGPIETHHIVPRRYNGIDDQINFVDLCSSCHEKLEQLYGRRFYNRIGAREAEESYLPRETLERIASVQSELFLDDSIDSFNSRPELLERLIDEFDLNETVCHACHKIATPTDTEGDSECCKFCGTPVSIQ